jgi:hypothetical protein
MLGGVKISESSAQKDELILEGNDIQNVSQSGTFKSTASLNDSLTSYSSRFHPGRLSRTEQGYS